MPSDLEDLIPLIDEGNFIIYGKKGNKPVGDLSQKFIDKIKAVKIENHLLNLNVVIWSGRTTVYASYDDQIMALPYEKEFNKEPNEQYAKDLLAVYSALALLTKKE